MTHAGEVLAFGMIPQAKPLLPVVDNSIMSELATQHVTPKQEIMVMTTAGQPANLLIAAVLTVRWVAPMSYQRLPVSEICWLAGCVQQKCLCCMWVFKSTRGFSYSNEMCRCSHETFLGDAATFNMLVRLVEMSLHLQLIRCDPINMPHL